jgi:uncharacterized protein
MAKNEQGLHIVTKPIGPVCNLGCSYCFYLEKQALFDTGENYRMSDEVLATFIRSYITTQATPVVEFVWQGGEPTLLGIDFFRRVVELQSPFTADKTITNSLQTNGTLLNDKWCVFLKQHNFMVGISLDGPREIHDRYRCDHQGNGSFDEVMRGLKLLQKHGVEYNVMATVAGETTHQPLEVYHFFKELGVEFIQFVPVIERLPANDEQDLGLNLAGPAALDREELNTKVTPWTVIPEEYADFLIAIYEDWVRNDVGRTFVMNFEWALNAWIGNPSSICIHAKQCGRSLVIEHNGDLFACDHYVYPQFRLGNILTDGLAAMVEASLQTGFGVHKESSLPRWCLECDVLAACQGGCPKHRFSLSPQTEPGLHYLCAGYRKFFLHIRKYLHAMTTLLGNGFPASEVMKAIDGPLMINLGSRSSDHDSGM